MRNHPTFKTQGQRSTLKPSLLLCGVLLTLHGATNPLAAQPATPSRPTTNVPGQNASPDQRNLILIIPILESGKISISSRDPFISAEVKDPYVLEAPVIEESDKIEATNDLIQFVKESLKEALQKSVFVLGVSSGEPNQGNFAIIQGLEPKSIYYDEGPQTAKEGETVQIKMTSDTLQILQKAQALAQMEGFEFNIGIKLPKPPLQSELGGAGVVPPATNEEGQNSVKPEVIEVKVKKIDRRQIVFVHNATGEEFEVFLEREKNLRLSQEDPNADPGNSPPNNPNVKPPPKL